MSRVVGTWDLVKEKMEFDERIVTNRSQVIPTLPPEIEDILLTDPCKNKNTSYNLLL